MSNGGICKHLTHIIFNPMMLHFAFVTVLYSAVLRGSLFNYVYEPQSRFARLWLDTIIAQSDGHNQNMYR